MQLTNSFTVPVPADTLWQALTDVERIAPCVPGFQLQEANDPEYRGAMKVKVGAITVQYDAVITFVERDDAARRAVLSVRGSERRGAGSVSATVTSTLTDHGDQTAAHVVTDVNVTGRVAQFGRGIIADVSSRIVEQFVECLNERVLVPPGPAAATSNGTVSEPVRPTGPEAAPLDLGAASVIPVLKRVAPVALAWALIWVIARACRRRGS